MSTHDTLNNMILLMEIDLQRAKESIAYERDYENAQQKIIRIAKQSQNVVNYITTNMRVDNNVM